MVSHLCAQTQFLLEAALWTVLQSLCVVHMAITALPLGIIFGALVIPFSVQIIILGAPVIVSRGYIIVFSTLFAIFGT